MWQAVVGKSFPAYPWGVAAVSEELSPSSRHCSGHSVDLDWQHLAPHLNSPPVPEAYRSCFVPADQHFGLSWWFAAMLERWWPPGYLVPAEHRKEPDWRPP